MAVTQPPWLNTQGGGGVQVPGGTAPQPTASRQISARSDPTKEVQDAAGVDFAASGIVPVEFGLIDVAAGLDDSQLYRTVAHSTPSGRQLSWVSPFRGSIVAMTARTDANKTSGTLTVAVFQGGTELTAAVSIADGASSAYAALNGSDYPVAAGDLLDLRVTSTSLLPAGSLDLLATLYVAIGKDLASAQS